MDKGGGIIATNLSKEQSEEIFKQELKLLNEEKYITDEVYSTVLNRYIERKLKRDEKVQVTSNTVVTKIIAEESKVKPQIRVKTKEEERELNLSILLALGTAFIFLAGLIFGLSTWDSMNDILRITTLLIMGTVFFGVSVLSENKLKLIKTGFSFWVLGTLFLPLSLFTMKYLTNLSVINGSVFNILIGMVSIAIFIYTYKKYEKEAYIYLALAALDFILINFTLAIVGKMVYSVLLIVALNGYLITYRNKYSFVEKAVMVNAFSSIILLAINASNTEIFYMNSIAIAALFIYFNYLNNKAIALYSRTSMVMLTTGFSGICFNIIKDYFLVDYVLAIPLVLFLLTFGIYEVIKKLCGFEDRYFYKYSRIIGFISLVVIAMIASSYKKYLVLTVIGMLINISLLLYIYNKYRGERFKAAIKGSSIFIILYLLVVTTEIIFPKESIFLKIYIMVAILFTVWTMLRKVKFIEVIYNPILILINSFTLIFAIAHCGTIYGELQGKPVFIPFFLIAIVGYYSRRIGLLDRVYKFASPISAFVGLVMTINLFYMEGLGRFFTAKNANVHLLFMIVIVLNCIFAFKKLFKYSSKYDIAFVIATNIIMIVCLAVDIYRWTSILVMISIAILILYYGYKLFIGEYLIAPYLLSFNFAAITLSILLRMDSIRYKYLVQIPILIAFIVAMAVYLYFKEKDSLYKNLCIYYTLYLLACSTVLPLKFYTNLFIAIIVFVVAYAYKRNVLNIINLIQGIILILINGGNTDTAWFFYTTLMVAIVLRVAGLKLYSQLEEGNPIDTLGVLSLVTGFVTLNSCYGQFIISSAWLSFIGTMLYTVFILAEATRRKSNLKEIFFISQLILSLGSFITLNEIGVEGKYLSKVALLLILLVFLTIKKYWIEFYEDNMGVMLKVVFTAWCMQDVIIYNSIFNSIIVSLILIISLLYSMKKKDKVFVNIAIVNLVLVALIQSREMIFRLPWWVYLLLVGSAFVGIAMYLEKNKKSN